MKYFIIAFAMIAGSVMLNATEASAVVCAHGMYRAGCVGPRGGVVVHRGYHAGVHRGRVYRR